MSSDLEWVIDDDESEGEWELPAALPVSDPRRPVRPDKPHAPRRSLLPQGLRKQRALLFVLALFLGLIGGLAKWVVDRVNEQRATERNAVSSLIGLEDRFAKTHDAEGLSALQDGEYPGWRAWQGIHNPRLAQAGLSAEALPDDVLWSWSGLLDTLFVPAGAARYGDVVLDGDRAQVSVSMPFSASLPGIENAVSFDMHWTQYYRMLNGAWIHTGPPSSGWQNMTTAYGKDLAVQYPQQDADLLAPLARRLDGVAAQACADVGCSRGQPVMIVSANPADLVTTHENRGSGTLTLYVPAPSLLGRPAGASGMDTLYRLYAINLTRVIVQNATRESGASLTPWLHWELSRAGLQEPLARSELTDTAREALHSGTNPLSGALSPATLWLALDFLSNSSGEKLSDVLDSQQALSLHARLRQLTDQKLHAWWDYLQNQATLTAAYSSTAQLAVVCNGDVMLWDASTGALRPTGVENAYRADWSPNGQWLVTPFLSARFALLNISTNVVRTGSQSLLAWSPGGQTVAVQIEQNRYMWQLGNPPATALRFLAQGRGWVGWSTGGSRMAYAGFQDGAGASRQANSYLFVAAPDGSAAKSVAPGNRGFWSPGGRYLAVASYGSVGKPITIYDSITDHITALITPTAGILYDVAWSPAAFVSGRAGVDGGAYAGVPALAIASYLVDPEHPQGGGEVKIVDLQGETLRQWQLKGLPHRLRWSPDGSALGWAVLEGGDGSEIIIAQPNGNGVEHLVVTSRPGFIMRWDWSPDGQWIALDSATTQVWSTADYTSRVLPPGCHAPAWRPAPGNPATQAADAFAGTQSPSAGSSYSSGLSIDR